MGDSRQGGLFDDLASSARKPQSDSDWFELETAVSQLFTPHGPIDEDSLFAGRLDIISNIIDIVFQKGCHAIIFGERGVGKTSLANIIKYRVFSRTKRYRVIKRNCTARHNFSLIWRQVLDDYVLGGQSMEHVIPDGCDAYQVLKVIKAIEADETPVFIIDEFDRISDEKTYEEMADLLKYMSDEGLDSTIIVVGVGESVHNLFGSHPSIHRNTKQIKMPKMANEELREVISKRLPILQFKVNNETLKRIIDLSQGFPGYTHLIAQATFRSAAVRRSMDVEEIDLRKGIAKCVADADEIVQSEYADAVRSTKDTHYYKEALTAFALTKSSDRGFFRAKDVKSPFSHIMQKPMDIPNFARHLKEFQEPERGPVLIRRGKPKSYEYKFANPLLKPFAILCGIKEGIISMSDYAPD